MINVLITGGATKEPIDDVRYITNFSTGATAARLADYISREGTLVKVLTAEDAELPLTVKNISLYKTFEDLNFLLKEELSKKKTDVVIHAAAVSDYSVESLEVDGEKIHNPIKGKVDSSKDLKLTLKRNFKIVDHLREYSNNSLPMLVAFKLTNTLSLEERTQSVQKLFKSSGANLIVHNDMNDMSSSNHRYEIFGPSQSFGIAESKNQLATKLMATIQSLL